ncbi:hypothetical protein MMC28_010488 [Mycoblastus sanguinarius]|nr:hypothetical protein [Mycoblastus sanguinarius]
MKFLLAALALVAVGANAQSTVIAPCGTSCPSAAPAKMITRTAPASSEGTPCPSLIVSSIGTNGTNPTVTTGSPSPTHFTGGANHVAGPVGVVVAAAAAAVAFAM